MVIAYVVVAVATAGFNTAAAVVDFVKAGWLLDNMAKYGLPESWLFPLGAAKAAGALGLLAGIAVPAVGIAAAGGLIAFFVGAVITVVRARCYDHLPRPGTFLLLAVGALALRLATL